MTPNYGEQVLRRFTEQPAGASRYELFGDAPKGTYGTIAEQLRAIADLCERGLLREMPDVRDRYGSKRYIATSEGRRVLGPAVPQQAPAARPLNGKRRVAS